MRYTELTCRVEKEEHSDILVAFLADYNYDTFYNETDTLLKAYIKSELFDENIIKQLQDDLAENVPFSFEINICKDENWNQLWEESYKPVLIDDKCFVRAPFHDKRDNIEFDIVIQPKMSFGTAHHETTYQMLSEALNMDFKTKTVLDMGCGTGVIAILAAIKNATEVWAIDNDEWAYNNTLENVKRNNVNSIKVFHGDATLLKKKKFDVIFANINRNILLNDLATYVEAMNDNAIIIMSGFYKEDITLIRERAESLGLRFVSSRLKNKWAVTNFTK